MNEKAAHSRNRDDQPLANEPDLMLAILRAGQNADSDLRDAAKRVEDHRERAGLGPGDEKDLLARLERACGELEAARCISRSDSGHLTTTKRGHAVLEQNPTGVDGSVLEKFPEYIAFLEAEDAVMRADAEGPSYNDGLAAFHDGAGYDDNPHPPDTHDHRAWRRGWNQASDEHDPDSDTNEAYQGGASR